MMPLVTVCPRCEREIEDTQDVAWVCHSTGSYEVHTWCVVLPSGERPAGEDS